MPRPPYDPVTLGADPFGVLVHCSRLTAPPHHAVSMTPTPTPLDQLGAEFAEKPAWVAQIERENDELERQRTEAPVAPMARPQFEEARVMARQNRSERMNPGWDLPAFTEGHGSHDDALSASSADPDRTD